MENYKDEIRASRKGCLGSSDATMLARIANAGVVPKSAYKRLAVCKGLIEHEDVPVNAAMAAGDFIENEIFKYISATDDRYLSNPMWVSKKYSRHNVKLISHPDIVLMDEKTKTIYIYEVKTTSEPVEATKYLYKAQLYVHNIIGKEIAAEKKWRVKVFLLHYDTNGLDLTQGIEFDPSRLTKSVVRFHVAPFDVNLGMDIVSKFLDDMNEYYAGDEIEESYLPIEIKEQFDALAVMVAEVKERENKIADFKAKLYKFLNEKDIKSIKGEKFTITRVDESVVASTDYKALFENEIAAKTPRKAKRLAAKYRKETKKKGYVTIKEKVSKEQ